MTINLSDKELKDLVQTNVASLVGADQDRLKVSFTKRGNQIDTSVEILAIGQARSIIDESTETVAKAEAANIEDVVSQVDAKAEKPAYIQ